MTEHNKNNNSYWRSNLRIVGVLLTLWFVVSFLLSIVFVDALDTIRIGGFGLGFWLAQQGSIYLYLILIVVYLVLMDRLDARYHVSQKDAADKAEQEKEDA